MAFEPPRPRAGGGGRAEDIEVVVFGVPALRSSFDHAENALELHDTGGLEVPLRAQSALEEAMGRDALLAGHVPESDTISLAWDKMPIKALISIERPRSSLKLGLAQGRQVILSCCGHSAPRVEGSRRGGSDGRRGHEDKDERSDRRRQYQGSPGAEHEIFPRFQEWTGCRPESPTCGYDVMRDRGVRRAKQCW